MKRAAATFLSTFYTLSVLFYSLALAVPAHAEWVTEEIKWQSTALSSSTGGISTTSNTYTTFNGADVLDTTGVFKPRGQGSIGMASSATIACKYDSLIYGFLIVAGDSTIASTFSTSTFAIDARMGGFGSPAVLTQWMPVDTVSAVAAAANAPVAVFAVRVPTLFANQSTIAYDALRARTTAGVGIMYHARVFWKYWKPDSNDE